ncbi:MAG: hypothetical protein WBM50_02455 [Acidimicrobiales bacterium]
MSRRRMWASMLCVCLVAAAIAGCGDGDDATTTTTAPDGQSTADTAGTTATTGTSGSPTTASSSTTATTLTSTSAPENGTTSSIGNGEATVESVVAATQAVFDEEFAAAPDTPPQVLGAIEISCDRTGAVGAGDVLACTGTPRTEPGFDLDPVGILFAILDDGGTAAWATGTDLPDDEAALARLAASATPGLFCRDLVDPDAQAKTGFFDATTTNESFGYFLSVVYWFIEGRPDRLDEDGNGIPCETVHDADVVAAIWNGGDIG